MWRLKYALCLTTPHWKELRKLKFVSFCSYCDAVTVANTLHALGMVLDVSVVNEIRFVPLDLYYTYQRSTCTITIITAQSPTKFAWRQCCCFNSQFREELDLYVSLGGVECGSVADP